MKQKSGDFPIACRLTDAEFRKREATLLARFKSAVIATEELPDGYVFPVPGDKRWMAVVWELIVVERECCPFLTFELTAPPNRGPVSVRVTGPSGYQRLFENHLMQFRRVFLTYCAGSSDTSPHESWPGALHAKAVRFRLPVS
jgi:hypothetical protein